MDVRTKHHRNCRCFREIMMGFMMNLIFFYHLPFAFGQPVELSFIRVNETPISADTGQTQGSSWVDFDGDNDMDLLVNSGFSFEPQNKRNYFYRNDGGVFTSVNDGPLPSLSGNYGGSAWADYDGDGDLDVYVTQIFFDNKLYSNDGFGSFVEQKNMYLADSGGASIGGVWVDYDLDGDLDLYVVNGEFQRNVLYHNEGQNGFSIVQSALEQSENYTVNSSWGDYDNDGDLDVFEANWGVNDLYENQGNGNFFRVPQPGGDMYRDDYLSSGFFMDLNNDGKLDIVVGQSSITPNDRPKILQGNGDGTFVNRTGGLDSVVTTGVGVGLEDFDNDGDIDVLFPGYPPLLYRNEGNFNLVPATFPNASSLTCSIADYDNDGDLDIFLGDLFEPFTNSLWQNNTSPQGNWITITLVGLSPNTTAIGTRVKAKATIKSEAVWQMRELTQQTSYGGHNDMRIHFGLGDATAIDSLVIRWPLGELQMFENVQPNRFVRIMEGVDEIEDIPVSVADRQQTRLGDFRLLQNYPNPFNPSTQITYSIAKTQLVGVHIYNLLGERIRTLVHERQIAGHHSILWDGRNQTGMPMPSGLYIYQLRAGNEVENRRMLLLR